MPDKTEVLERIREVYGSSCELASIERIHRGAHKQVYFLRLVKPTQRCVMYVWDYQADYFADRRNAGFEDTRPAGGPALFDANTRFLLDQGLRVPSVIHRGTLESGPEYALVEEIEGIHWDKYAARVSSPVAEDVFGRIHDQVNRLHSISGSSPGWLVEVAGVRPPSIAGTIDKTLQELSALAEADPDINRERERIAARVFELREEITPRSEFTLVHGEIPHHILIRHHDKEVFLVDIEGVRFFDVEVDYVQFQLWWPEEIYRAIARNDLDPARMALYTFSWHVSSAYAGSGMLKGDFPDQRLAGDIYEYNVRKAVAIL